MLETRIFVSIFVGVKGMYKCKTGYFGNEIQYLCFLCCRRYVHMWDWAFCKWDVLFIFVLLKRLCTHIRLGILAASFCFYFLSWKRVCTNIIVDMLAMSVCVSVYVVVKCIYTCKTGNVGNDRLCLCLCCCRGYLHI